MLAGEESQARRRGERERERERGSSSKTLRRNIAVQQFARLLRSAEKEKEQ